jgi:hypothetical protein
MLFEKPSLRTRVSFDVAMYELGGHAVYLPQQEVGLGDRESIGDVAHTLDGLGRASWRAPTRTPRSSSWRRGGGAGHQRPERPGRTRARRSRICSRCAR